MRGSRRGPHHHHPPIIIIIIIIIIFRRAAVVMHDADADADADHNTNADVAFVAGLDAHSDSRACVLPNKAAKARPGTIGDCALHALPARRNTGLRQTSAIGATNLSFLGAWLAAGPVHTLREARRNNADNRRHGYAEAHGVLRRAQVTSPVVR